MQSTSSTLSGAYVTAPSISMETGHTLSLVSASPSCSADLCPEFANRYSITEKYDTSFKFTSTGSSPDCRICYEIEIEGSVIGSGTFASLIGTAMVASVAYTGKILRDGGTLAVSTSAYPGCTYSYSNLAMALPKSASSRSTPASIAFIFTVLSLALVSVFYMSGLVRSSSKHTCSSDSRRSSYCVHLPD